jgi:hypothetical protein
MTILMVLDYPFLSVINICSNGQFYDRCQHLFAATLYLSLSLALCYLALSPQLSVDYLTLLCPTIVIIE